MNRRGFALVAALWLLVAMAAIATSGFGFARERVLSARNRNLLARAEWAREACLEIGRARFRAGAAKDAANPEGFRSLVQDSVALGDLLWCDLEVRDAGSRFDFNHGDSTTLACLLGSPMAARIVLSMRPLASVVHLGALLKVDSAETARLSALLTPYGTGQVNLNGAPVAVLACLPGLGADGAVSIVAHRKFQKPFGSLEEVMAVLPPSAQKRARLRSLDLSRIAVTAPPLLVVVVTGWAGRPNVQARMTVLASTRGTEIQIGSRETE